MKPTPYTHTTHTNNSTNTNTNTTIDNNNTSSNTNNTTHTHTSKSNSSNTNTPTNNAYSNTTINLDASITNAYNITPTFDLETGSNLKMGGPFWSDVLHDQSVVDELLRRIEEDAVGSNSNTSSSSSSGSSSSGSSAVGGGSAVGGSSTGGSGSGNMPYPIPTVDRVHGVLTTISEELKVSILYVVYNMNIIHI